MPTRPPSSRIAGSPATRTLKDRMFATLQRALPTHALSRGWLRFTRVHTPWISKTAIEVLYRLYDIDLSEAQESDPRAYSTLNDFFTRALKPGVRPLPSESDAIACPADGILSQVGTMDSGRIVQAKGHVYDVTTLFGGDRALAERFIGGCFCTLYLAPHNYHRVHMPSTGRLEEMVYVPGRLFSVNPSTARALPGLFTRNERVVTVWDTDAGPMALVLVGAMLVGAIDTVWAGTITPPTGHSPSRVRYPETGPDSVVLERGEEMGRFNMGSSVILIYAPGTATWLDRLVAGLDVLQGQALGSLNTDDGI